jgi:hypothetical protein
MVQRAKPLGHHVGYWNQEVHTRALCGGGGGGGGDSDKCVCV